MDTAVGDFVRGDILIKGKKIAAIAPDLGAAATGGNAIVVEAADRIVIPGMVDCHRHAWEGQLRGIIPNSATIGDYMGATHRGFAPFYQPEDMYVGNLATAIGCLDAGITCVIDNSHNARSQTHSDAAIQAVVQFRHTRGPRFGRSDLRRMGPWVAAGFRAADEAVLLVRRSTCDVPAVLAWTGPRKIGKLPSVSGFGSRSTAPV